MTKQDIVNVVSKATGLTKVETEAVMNGVMTTIINALTENQRVELRGFGTFGVNIGCRKKLEILVQVKPSTCRNDLSQPSNQPNRCEHV